MARLRQEEGQERNKGMSDVKSELHGTVMSIVHELEAAAEGNLYYDGSDCIIIDDMDAWKEEQFQDKVKKFKADNPEDKFDSEEMGFDTYEEWMEDEIGTADDVEEPDEMSIYEYIDKQSLGDVRFEVDENLDLDGGKVLFCCGGPTVWVHDDEVCGYWGSESVEMSLDSDTRSQLYSYFDELLSWAKDRLSR